MGAIKKFGNAFDERNNYFHKLYGLPKDKLFKIWNAKDSLEWQNNVLGCLKFLSLQKFSCLKDASLISQVHKELENALQSYQP